MTMTLFATNMAYLMDAADLIINALYERVMRGHALETLNYQKIEDCGNNMVLVEQSIEINKRFAEEFGRAPYPEEDGLLSTKQFLMSENYAREIIKGLTGLHPQLY